MAKAKQMLFAAKEDYEKARRKARPFINGARGALGRAEKASGGQGGVARAAEGDRGLLAAVRELERSKVWLEKHGRAGK